MAYMNQEKKKALSVKIKEVLKKYGMKASLSVRHHSTLVATITKGDIDFSKHYEAEGTVTNEHISVNEYCIDSHWSGVARDFLTELKDAMNACEDYQNFDNSDPMTDYFHVGWYIDINVGRWNKPYELTGA